MTYIRTSAAALLLVLAIAAFGSDPGGTAPKIVTDMIDAHGGMAPWEGSTVVSFTHTAFMPGMPGRLHWMISHEVFEQESRRAYAEHPHWDSRIGNDNKEVWSVNWPFPNRPSQMIGIHYYFAFLPWLSQDQGVVFGDPGEGTVPGDETVYTTVDFWYDSDAGDTDPKNPDTWTFYIHPETNMMAAFGIEFAQGKAIHKIDGYTEVDGLVIPSDFVTHAGPQARVIGYHAVTDATLHGQFDEARLEMPEGGTVDR